MLTLETFPTSNVMIVQVGKTLLLSFPPKMLIEISPVVLVNQIFKCHQCISATSLSYISTWKRHDPSFEQYCIPLY